MLYHHHAPSKITIVLSLCDSDNHGSWKSNIVRNNALWSACLQFIPRNMFCDFWPSPSSHLVLYSRWESAHQIPTIGHLLPPHDVNGQFRIFYIWYAYKSSHPATTALKKEQIFLVKVSFQAKRLSGGEAAAIKVIIILDKTFWIKLDFYKTCQRWSSFSNPIVKKILGDQAFQIK